MHKSILLGVAIGMASSAVAHAGTEVAVGTGLMPAGDITTRYDGASLSARTDTGYTLRADLGGHVRPALRIAAAAQFLGGVAAQGAPASASVFLFGMRLEPIHAVAPTTELYVFLQPALGYLSAPDSNSGGFALSGGGGARFPLHRDLRGFAEVGYLWSVYAINGARVDVSYLALDAGIHFDL